MIEFLKLIILKLLLNPMNYMGLILIFTSYYLQYDFPLFSTSYITLTVLYFFIYSIVIFDIRLIQEREYNNNDCGSLPKWVNIFYIVSSIIAGFLIVLNWKLFFALFIVRYILKHFPILETLGSFLMLPFFIPPRDGEFE